MPIERWRPFGSTLDRWEPFRGPTDIQSEVNRLFDNFFSRPAGLGVIPLPMPVQTDKVKAAYRDGVLEIKLPKAEAVKPKEIKIDIL